MSNVLNYIIPVEGLTLKDISCIKLTGETLNKINLEIDECLKQKGDIIYVLL